MSQPNQGSERAESWSSQSPAGGLVISRTTGPGQASHPHSPPPTHTGTRVHTQTQVRTHAQAYAQKSEGTRTHMHSSQLHCGVVSWSEPHSFWCEWTKPTLSVPRTQRQGVSRPLGEGGSVTIAVLGPCPPPSPPGTQTTRQGCAASPSSGHS